MRLTSTMLKRIIEEEVSKTRSLDKSVTAKEVDADEYADALENKIDYVKALKLEEKRLVKRLQRISEERARVTKSIVRSI